MKICVIGAGAMGGLYGCRLLLSGKDVQFIETRQQAVDALNTGTYLFDGIDDSIVSELKILSAYPNPFNPVTNISYYVNQNANIDVSVYNLMGRKDQSLDNSFKESGEYTISWDAYNHASGIYYIQISNGEQIKTQKITLIK